MNNLVLSSGSIHVSSVLGVGWRKYQKIVSLFFIQHPNYEFAAFTVININFHLVCTWAVCFLTTYEEIQKKLYEEIDQVLGKGPITSEKIEELR